MLMDSYRVLFGTGKSTSACELMSNADFWLMRTYWDFNFPRPLLPNFKYIGGIHCRPAKPLPKVGLSPLSLGYSMFHWIDKERNEDNYPSASTCM